VLKMAMASVHGVGPAEGMGVGGVVVGVMAGSAGSVVVEMFSESGA
jgi:hypothetical protein